MGDLETDTAVEPIGEDGRSRARLSRDWEIWGPNGGYLAVIALRAAGATTPLRRPASFTCHFLGVADFDAVDLEVRPLRVSKRAAALAVSMRQHDRPILEAVTWIVGDDAEGLEHDAAPSPDVEGPDGLLDTRARMPADAEQHYPAFWSNFEERPLRWIGNWLEREPGEPHFQSWFRYQPTSTFDDPFVDAGRALLLVDTLGWPAAVRAYRADIPFIAPSLDVSVRFHGVPETEWLLCDARSPVARDGLVASSASVWASDGRLVASGGQQMLCRPAPPLG
jgi:acyl-CoA thioesterase